MDEEGEDGGPTSKTTLSGEHSRQSKATSPERQERTDSPGPMKSYRSMETLKDVNLSIERREKNQEELANTRWGERDETADGEGECFNRLLSLCFPPSLEHGHVWRLKPTLKKYACDLSLDPNTAFRLLSLSEDNRKVKVVGKDQSYPYHPDRFDSQYQVFCGEDLTGRCYWESRSVSGPACWHSVLLQSVPRSHIVSSNSRSLSHLVLPLATCLTASSLSSCSHSLHLVLLSYLSHAEDRPGDSHDACLTSIVLPLPP
ncbi:unnamed protein product [Arctogadus glacialis]